MLETKCVGDGFGHNDHRHPLSFYISVGHQHSNIDVLADVLSAGTSVAKIY